MSWRSMFRRKSLETLLAEMAGEHRLHRVLGAGSLTALGVGAIIGAGIFAMTGRVAAQDAGPAVMVSFAVAGIACAFAALCYAEFAAMAPVAGSAYTYTYATLGEVWAWIIGWDLVLEYAMSCAVVAAHWTGYLDELLKSTIGYQLPAVLTSDPFTPLEIEKVDPATGKTILDALTGKPELIEVQAWCNLPAMLIMALVTTVLVIGIRQSALTNAILVVVKVAVVLFVIALGIRYVDRANWNTVPVEARQSTDVSDFLERNPEKAALVKPDTVSRSTTGKELLKANPQLAEELTSEERGRLADLRSETNRWGLLGVLGIRSWLQPLDDSVRSSFMPYGLSGVMVGAALVFFAFIGFDSISTHAEEAIRPQRDVPVGILVSLGVCTVLYMLVSGVIAGMEPYPEIDTKAAVAAAFRKRAAADDSLLLNASAGLIAAGALAGMTSVLLVTFLSQARVFLAMARDGLLPQSIFAAIHERFRTPHRSTILTGIAMALVAGLSPIRVLEEMVNIGTLLAFVLVCASVMVLRITRPNAERPFRCPALYVVAPLGILVNLVLMLFLTMDTWFRLVIWLGAGLLIYFCYGWRHSTLGHNLERQLHTQGASPTDAPLE